jgi:hypothetical protein
MRRIAGKEQPVPAHRLAHEGAKRSNRLLQARAAHQPRSNLEAESTDWREVFNAAEAPIAAQMGDKQNIGAGARRLRAFSWALPAESWLFTFCLSPAIAVGTIV